MTNDRTQVRLITPAHPADQLSEAVIAALTRKMSPRLRWGPVQTLVLGLLSGGLLPLVYLHHAFGDFIRAEQTHLWHFAQWMRVQFPSKESEALLQSADRLRFRRSFQIGSLAVAALALFWAWSDLHYGNSHPINARFIYDQMFRPTFTHEVNRSARMLLAVAAHLLWFWQIVAHATDIQRFGATYNAAAEKFGLAPLRIPRFRIGFSPLWILGALLLLGMGEWWGLPMMLAAGAQARYINGTGRVLRLELAARVFNTIAARRPVLDVTMPAAIRGKCAQQNCAGTIPAGSAFCPRCGARVAAQSEFRLT